MKKVIYMFFATAMFLASCATQPADQVTIKGDIDGLDNETLYLKARVDRKWVDMDSAQVKNGKFILKGTISEPQIAYLASNNEDMFHTYELFVEPGNIKISGHIDDPDFKVTGSKPHAEMQQMWKDLEPFEEHAENLYGQYMMAAQNDDIVMQQEIEAQFEANDAAELKVKENFIRNHPKSYYSLYLIRSSLIYYASLEELEMYKMWLDPEMLNTTMGQFLTERIETLKKISIGSLAPEIALLDASGNILKLSSLRGNYVLVDFWASWCRPCRIENPNVVAAYQEFHDKGFDIYGVSLDDNPGKWEAAIQEDNLTWYHVIDNGWNGESVKEYGVMSIPSNYLLDPNGRIVAMQLRGEALHDKLKELLN